MEITSAQNPKLKRLKKLKSKKYRDRFEEYILEGYKSIKLVLDEGIPLKEIYVEKSQRDNFFEKLALTPAESEGIVFFVEDELLKPLFETDNPQGILAVAEKKKTGFHDLWKDGIEKVVLLDRVQDPGNLGTIVRTAESAGYDLVVCTAGCADLFNQKTIRSTMGSIVTMNVACEADGSEVLDFLKSKGFVVYSSSLYDSVDYRHVEKRQPHVLVLGNEGSGIGEEILEKSDWKVKIPMCGKAESLNVSVAAGILLYHFADPA